MDLPVRVELFGGLRLRCGEREVTRFRTRKSAALLAYLAFHRGRRHPREALLEVLWPEADFESARHNLRQALYSLRRQLEPPGTPRCLVLPADNSWVGLSASAVTTDVADFELAVESARRSSEPADQATLFQRALALYHAELLPGFYEDWTVPERWRLTELHYQATRSLTLLCEEAGELELAVQHAMRAVAADPLREEACGNLMRLLAAAGEPSEAIRQYRRLESALRQELSAVPSPFTRQLALQIERECGERPGREAARAGGLGDIPVARRPVPRTSRVASEAAGPPAPSVPPWALQLHLTRFVGRSVEILRLLELLAPAQAGQRTPDRLVTVTGLGGTGKTRLALEAAARLLPDYGGAVTYVPLEHLGSPALLVDAVHEALRLPRASGADPLEAVVQALSSGPWLLVLDNFEQLLPAGAAHVQAILLRAPALKCVVTSRERLQVAGEQEVALDPLPVPAGPGTPEQLLDCESVELLVDRAQAARPDFQITTKNAAAVAELCRRLEGIPLALELAAARAQVLTPTQMLSHLSQRFDFLITRRQDIEERHRTMRAAMDWSHHLLSPELRVFLARLSVFRGGWTLEAATAVTGDVPDSGPAALLQVSDRMARLRECSLLLAEEDDACMRFRMLETVREHAAELLDAGNAAATRGRHAAYYLALAERAEPELKGFEQREWFSRLDREHENLRVALDSCVESGDAGSALRLGAALWWFWFVRGHIAEARKRLTDVLALPAAGHDYATRARVLRAAGRLSATQGEHDAARALQDESLSIERRLGDRAGLASALYAAALVPYYQHDHLAARTLYEQALRLWRELDNQPGIADALYSLGLLAHDQAEYDDARRLYLESLALRRALGDRGALSETLQALGAVAMRQGDFIAARTLYEESLEIAREAGDATNIAGAVGSVGRIAGLQGDYETAGRLCRESLALYREIGHRRGAGWALYLLGTLALRHEDWAAARAALRESLVIRAALAELGGVATSLEALAAVSAREGGPAGERAALLFGAAETLRGQTRLPLPPDERPAWEALLAQLRESMGDAAFDRALQAGRGLPWEQAASLASIG